MRISLLQDNLKHGLALVSKSVPKKPSLPILETVHLSTDHGQVMLSTTNLDWFVRVGIGASIEQDGSANVSFAVLNKLVSALSPERVELEGFKDSSDKFNHALNVTCGATTTKIRGFDPADYPVLHALPEDLTSYISMPVGKFIEAVKAVEFCAAPNADRPVLQSVYLELAGNTLGLTSVDGYQLAHKDLEVITVDGTQDFKAVVPVDVLNDVCWVLEKHFGKNSDEVVFISLDETQLLLNSGSIEIRLYLLDGSFPDWRQIIPRSFDVHATVDPVTLRQALKRASACMESSTHRVGLEIAPSLLTVVVDEHEIKQRTVLDAVSECEIINGAKLNQLDTILAHLPSGKNVWTSVKLSLNSSRGTSTQPIKIQHVQDETTFYVLMSSEKGR